MRSELAGKSLALLLLTSLAACSPERRDADGNACPTYVNGSFVEDRLSGERYIVTHGDPFINIHVGECAIKVEGRNRRGVISTYRVRPLPTPNEFFILSGGVGVIGSVLDRKDGRALFQPCDGPDKWISEKHITPTELTCAASPSANRSQPRALQNKDTNHG